MRSDLQMAVALVCLIWAVGLLAAINARVRARRTLLDAYRRMERDRNR